MVRDSKGVKVRNDFLSIELIVHFNMFDRMTMIIIIGDNCFNKALRFIIDLMGTEVRKDEKTSTARTTCRKPPLAFGTDEDVVLTIRISTSTCSPQ